MHGPWPAEPPADAPGGEARGTPPPWPHVGGGVPPIVRGNAAPAGGAPWPGRAGERPYEAEGASRSSGAHALPPPPARPSGGYPAVAGSRPSGAYPAVAPVRQTGRHGVRPTGAYALPPTAVPTGAFGEGTAAASGRPAPTTGHLRAVSAIPTDGDEVDGYRILSTIGRGSMGRVYRARDPMGRDVAIKLILGEQADAEGVQRFTREGQAMAAVPRHPNVVNVHSTGATRGLPYLVLDLVEGESLADVLKRGRLRPADAAGMTLKLARAVEHVHAAGVLHRDLKPANILIRAEDGEPVLSDFGMAGLRGADRLTRTGDLVGTPLYMPPEQVLGVVRRIDARSDVWALGAMLYEMLSGAPPFTGRTLVDVSRAITSNEPAPIDGVDPGLMGIVRRALAKRQEDRFQRAGELADALAAWGLGQAQAPAPPPPRASRLTLALVAAALVGVGAGGAALVVAARRAAEARAAEARDAQGGPGVAEPPAPEPAPGPPSPPSFGGFAAIVEHVRADRVFDAAREVKNKRRDGPDGGEEARAAESAAREHVQARLLAAAPPLDEEQLLTLLAVVGGLRELAGLEPAPDALVDVLLGRLREDMRALVDTGRGDPAVHAARAERLVEARLLPLDVPAADDAFEGLKEAYFFAGGRVSVRDYQRLLLCMVRFDLDVQHEHAVRVAELPPDLGRGAAVDYLNLRVRLEAGGDPGDARRKQAREVARLKVAGELLALADGPRGPELGPVTRARALAIGAAAAPALREMLSCLDRAAALDPRSPFPPQLKASLLDQVASRPAPERALQTDRDPEDLRREAAAAAVEALARLDRGYAARPALRSWQGAELHRSLVEVLVRAGDLARARDALAQAARYYPDDDELDDMRDELRRAEAAAREPRKSEF